VQNPSTGCTFFRPAPATALCKIHRPACTFSVLPPGRPLIAGPAHRATDSCTTTAVAGVGLFFYFILF